ncbi:hypothetical protein CBF34_06715 [Vagococcus penaei]|uniref:Uncharacterized protein n=1 Tax=Vagococcus penaei TaxID=633807 RepID=A0A1Q2D6Q0_9ENTE|nr:hypothetical protein [Vagococcus penaei]AQP54024.1 hypothetical protein BW732_07225 [Vagococcus penaei]RSU01741.1 hypothetical protein CBF34_06715 [Vagococcus penaei]
MKLFKNVYFWLFLIFLILGIFQLMTFFDYINFLNFLAGILFLVAAGLILLAVLKPGKKSKDEDHDTFENSELSPEEVEHVKAMMRENAEISIVQWISQQKNLSMSEAQKAYDKVLSNLERPF